MSTENEGGLFSCPVMSWIIGALLAVATYLILSGRFGLGLVLSLIIALGVLLLASLLLQRLFCRAPVSTHGHPARHDQDIAATRQSVVSADSNGAMVSGVPDATRAPTSSAAADVTAAASASKADSENAGEKPAAKPAAKAPAKAKAKSASAASTGVKKDAAKPAAKAAAKPAAKAATKAAVKPAAKKTAAKTATKPARKPVAKDGKPEMLTKARASGADDLKKIKGVGPKLETLLNQIGVYHFDQVSGWRAKEVQWVDDNLVGFKGRVSRDEWVKQAKALAKGDETEFSKKVAKGGVYEKNKK